MDIKSGSGYPASALSNFAGHAFVIDDVQCASMEGFLQSLKFDKVHIQEEVCKLIGAAAKRRGSPRSRTWQKVQTLWWRGVPMERDGDSYQKLLDRAFQAMFDQSESFRAALKASGDANLTHSIGKRKTSDTVLTERELCSRLMALRSGRLDQKDRFFR